MFVLRLHEQKKTNCVHFSLQKHFLKISVGSFLILLLLIIIDDFFKYRNRPTTMFLWKNKIDLSSFTSTSRCVFKLQDVVPISVQNI